MAEKLASLRKSGGQAKVLEAHIFMRYSANFGAQIIVNSTTNINRAPSANWTGNYIQYNDSTGQIKTLKNCRITVYWNSNAPTTKYYAIGETVCYSNWSQLAGDGSNIAVFVIG